MNEFKQWMDDHRITVERAADIFGKSVGTIRNWRSAGVPENLREWVALRIREEAAKDASRLPERITLTPTPEQFDQWNRAALDDGKIVRDWIHETLDRAAGEEIYSSQGNELRSVKAAEPTQENAYNAKAGDTCQNDKNGDVA